MWWVVSPPPPSKSFIPLIPKPLFAANSKPPGVRRSSAVPRSQKKQEGTKQLSGLDVLWAIQKAAAEKNKLSGGVTVKKKMRGIRSPQEEEDEVDYGNVKPLCIKNDWRARLDELEKSLEELSDSTK